MLLKAHVTHLCMCCVSFAMDVYLHLRIIKTYTCHKPIYKAYVKPY